MGDFVFNNALGRTHEFWSRVTNISDPDPQFIVVALSNVGLGTDQELRECDTLEELLTNANEVTNTGYARQLIGPADLDVLPAPDDVNNWRILDLDNVPFGNISTGDTWAKVVICYDSEFSASPHDDQVLPLTGHDYSKVPDGGPVTVEIVGWTGSTG